MRRNANDRRSRGWWVWPGPGGPPGGRRRGASAVKVGAAAAVALVALGAGPAGDAAVAGALPTQATCDVTATDRIESALREWRTLTGRRDRMDERTFEERANAFVADAFSLGEMGARIFGNDWFHITPHRQAEFKEALGRSIWIRLIDSHDPEEARLVRADDELNRDDGLIEADYRLDNGSEPRPVTFRMKVGGDGRCGIVDVRAPDLELLDETRDRVENLLDEYSFPYMVAEVGDYDHVVLEDFESTPAGELPVGWDWKDSDDDANKPYRVKIENGNRYLEATDEGESVILGKEINWNLHEYPYISFRVRVNRIPPGGDERYDDRVDSAAGIYLTLHKKFLGKIPESVKYVWSSTLPVGAAARRDGIGRPWQVVFGSGREGLGEWRTYVFDLRQAYRDTFGGDPPKKSVGIGVLSDANSVGGQAYADYDDIRALRTAPPGTGSGVREIVTP